MKCKSKYESLNVLYGGMEKNGSLCIDIEDAVRNPRYQMAPFLCSSFPFKMEPNCATDLSWKHLDSNLLYKLLSNRFCSNIKFKVEAYRNMNFRYCIQGWVILVIVVLGTWFYEHSYCTSSDIFLFLFLLTNVLNVSRFG